VAEAARLRVVVESDTRPLEDGLHRAQGRVSEFGGRASGVFQRLTGVLGAPIRALGQLGLAAGGISALTGAAGGLTGVLGIGLNNSMEQVNARLLAMTKDGAQSAKILADIRAEADKTPFAFEEMAQATASLLPASKQSGVALMDLVRQAEILAATNPAEGLEGAAFSLREALSGDFVSIVERFNLPRQRLNELKAQGVPAMEAISRTMKEMGLDATLVTGLAGTMSGRWSTFMDTLSGFASRFGAGLFDALKQGLLTLQGVLDRNKDAIGAFVDGAGRAIGEFAASAIPKIIGFAQDVLPKAIDAARRFGEIAKEVYDRLTTFFGSLLKGEELATAVNKAFGDLIPFELNAALDAVDAAFARVKEAFEEMVGAIKAGNTAQLLKEIGDEGGVAMPKTAEAVEKALPVFQRFGEMIAELAGTSKDATDSMSVRWPSLGDVLDDAVARMIGDITRFVQNAVEARDAIIAVVQQLNARFEEHRDLVVRVFGQIRTTIERVWGAVDAVTRSTWNALSPYLTKAWGALQVAAEAVFGAIQFVAERVWPAVQATITAAMAGAASAVSTRLAAIVGFFRDAQSTIASIVDAIKSVVERIFGEVESRANTARDVISGILDTVRGWLRDIEGALDAARRLVGQGRPSAPEPVAEGGGGEGGGEGASQVSAMAVPVAPVSSRAAQSTTNVNINLPAGVYYGSLTDLAYAVDREQARVVTAGQR
jgi:hypothetical protein